jgi:hypothetical protein
MAIKFLQQEIDSLMKLFESKNAYRDLLNKKAHLCEFNAEKLAKQLFSQTKRTKDYDDFRKAGGSKYKFEQTGGTKRESKFGAEKGIQAYTNSVLKAYLKLPFIKEGKMLRAGQYSFQTLEVTGNKVVFLIRGLGKTGGTPFNEFKRINKQVQVEVVRKNKNYRKLFGIEADANSDAFTAEAGKKVVTDNQQIGHADGSGVVDKKALSAYATMTSDENLGGTGYSAAVLLDEIKTEDGVTSYPKKLQDIFNLTLEGNHAQKFTIKDGKLTDDFTVSVSVEAEEANQAKSGRKSNTQDVLSSGKTETQLGQELSTLLKDLQKDLKKEYENPNTNAERKRSASPLEVVGYMVFAGSNLQKLLKNKKVTKKPSTPFVGKAPRQGAPKKVQSHTKKMSPQPSYSLGLIDSSIKRAIGPGKQDKAKRVEVGTSVGDSMVARAFINSRLQQQVARNMGRPALENRTGRFVESVYITNASSTGMQSHFDYTYNPLYRVFEGGRDFPPGYDPRDLIEKSIRQLAAARLETKFTLRRV